MEIRQTETKFIRGGVPGDDLTPCKFLLNEFSVNFIAEFLIVRACSCPTGNSAEAVKRAVLRSEDLFQHLCRGCMRRRLCGDWFRNSAFYLQISTVMHMEKSGLTHTDALYIKCSHGNCTKYFIIITTRIYTGAFVAGISACEKIHAMYSHSARKIAKFYAPLAQ